MAPDQSQHPVMDPATAPPRTEKPTKPEQPAWLRERESSQPQQSQQSQRPPGTGPEPQREVPLRKWSWHPKFMLRMFKDTYTEWSNDQVPRMGAALSYYTIFSIAPLLVIAIAIAG